MAKEMTYEEREPVYLNALVHFGYLKQMVKCLEELAECQQAIAKVILGGENFDHMAEEIADAIIMLEQMRMMFNIDEKVSAYMAAKVRRLDKRLKGDL